MLIVPSVAINVMKARGPRLSKMPGVWWAASSASPGETEWGDQGT
jgi:hypothetical protein